MGWFSRLSAMASSIAPSIPYHEQLQHLEQIAVLKQELQRAEMRKKASALALIAPPYLPYAPAWQAAGIDLGVLHVIEASPRDALWAFEQCLRSGGSSYRTSGGSYGGFGSGGGGHK